MLARNDVFSYDPLLAYAQDPREPLILAFASAIELARSSSRLAGREGFGLDHAEFCMLLDRYFPGARGVYIKPAPAVTDAARRAPADEFDSLLGLLLEHCRGDAVESRWLAHAIAACCMGDDHLWQDMGLADRKALSDLLAQHFPTLFARNTGGMRWKKFFYKQLCEREGAYVCRSPTCAECDEYANCFGPEEDDAWQPVKR
ncbi:nitrogen fixation protein NifQ [Methylococcus sp. Mc7]|uniref:nitrogen fixation protein NifQ n=1 Tax=Methylococcus sp. Mc7 TaxID=2860258 RepID=UPI001C52E5B9|nr:nitrogen fixation protein NifQ [Methylococcus sp. Mc7]QXP85063.1 nitrogen fixation protein NifQ [Methylococcus sp. Mc7]